MAADSRKQPGSRWPTDRGLFCRCRTGRHGDDPEHTQLVRQANQAIMDTAPVVVARRGPFLPELARQLGLCGGRAMP